MSMSVGSVIQTIFPDLEFDEAFTLRNASSENEDERVVRSSVLIINTISRKINKQSSLK